MQCVIITSQYHVIDKDTMFGDQVTGTGLLSEFSGSRCSSVDKVHSM